MLLSLVTALTTLALLGGADASLIQWRHAGPGDAKRFLVSCNLGPYGPANVGTPFTLAGNYAKYCSGDWQVTKDKLAQIYTTYNNGQRFCVDSTSNPANYAMPHIWNCYDGLDAQQWVFHSNGQIELRCTGLCLDVKDGYNGNDRVAIVQLYNCIPGNKNQEWDLVSNSAPS